MMSRHRKPGPAALTPNGVLPSGLTRPAPKHRAEMPAKEILLRDYHRMALDDNHGEQQREADRVAGETMRLPREVGGNRTHGGAPSLLEAVRNLERNLERHMGGAS